MRRLLVFVMVLSLAGWAGAAVDTSKTAPERGPSVKDGSWSPSLRSVVSEGFEGGVMPPAGWSQVITDASYTWKIAVVGTPHSGTYFADVEYDPSLASQLEVLYSPALNPTTNLAVQFWSQGSVYWCRDDYDNCDLEVWVDADTTWNNGNETLFYTAETDWPASWTWAQSYVDLAAAVGGSPVYIAFVYSGQDGAQVGLDDIDLLVDEEGPPMPCDNPVFSEQFESWPPAGWTITNNGGACIWDSNTNNSRPNYAGGSGVCADADGDACGSGTTMDTDLDTPAIDLSAATAATLWFVGSYNDLGSADLFEVRVSDDGGATWTTALTWNEDHDAYGPGEQVMVDLTPYMSSQVVIRFHYQAGWDWWAQIDDVRVCADTVVQTSSDLSIVKGAVNNGNGTGTYTLNVTNGGPDAATGVVVTDTLPAGVTYLSDDCGGSAVGGVFTWAVGDLAVATNAVCHLTVTIVDEQDTLNSATVVGAGQDPDATDNTSAAVIPAQPVYTGIPALGRTGAILLIVLLAGLGAFLISRRSS